MTVRTVLPALLIVGTLGWTGCAGPPPTDTGIVGSWQRIDRPRSTISISRDEGGLHFRQHYKKGQMSVRCKEPDVCSEYVGGNAIYMYRYAFTEDVETQEIFLRREGIPVDEKSTPLTEVDRLTVQPGGLELHASTIARNGETLERPTGPYRYKKTSDRPF